MFNTYFRAALACSVCMLIRVVLISNDKTPPCLSQPVILWLVSSSGFKTRQKSHGPVSRFCQIWGYDLAMRVLSVHNISFAATPDAVYSLVLAGNLTL